MKTLIIAPHADDETLGLGGTLLKRSSKKGNKLYWLLITEPQSPDYSQKFINSRIKQIQKIKKIYNFEKTFNLNLKPGSLDKISKKKIVFEISKIIKLIKPDEIFTPHLGDVHSDHKIISSVISTCTKNFRFKSIKRIFAYETLSETNFNLIKKNVFFPNYYEDISKFMNKKIKALKIYKSEVKKFPFPRSIDAIKALAKVRGSEIGVSFAEAFEVLKIIKK